MQKMQTSNEKCLLKKTSVHVCRMPKKDWNKLWRPTQCTSRPTSLWFGSNHNPIANQTPPKNTKRAVLHQYLYICLSCDSLFSSTGYATCRYKCAMFSSYTSKWSSDVEVHCIGCSNLFQSLFLASLLTLVF